MGARVGVFVIGLEMLFYMPQEVQLAYSLCSAPGDMWQDGTKGKQRVEM